METLLPACVAPQGRIRRSIPAHNACIFGMETPLRRCSGGHAGNRPLRHDEIQDKQDGQDEERDVEPLVLCGAEL